MTLQNIIGNVILSRIDKSCFPDDLYQSVAFSNNLQKFIRANPHFTHIYHDPESNRWFIGYKDGRIWAGAQFLAVLCKGSKTPIYSLNTYITDRFQDRTIQFWKCTAHFGRRMFPNWY